MGLPSQPMGLPSQPMDHHRLPMRHRPSQQLPSFRGSNPIMRRNNQSTPRPNHPMRRSRLFSIHRHPHSRRSLSSHLHPSWPSTSSAMGHQHSRPFCRVALHRSQHLHRRGTLITTHNHKLSATSLAPPLTSTSITLYIYITF
jgi:hypothetical protein